MGRNTRFVGAAAAILLGFSQPASADETRSSRVILRVYNFGAVPPETLRGVSGKVARTYRVAGVDVDWVEPLLRRGDPVATASAGSPRVFAVQIMIRPKAVSDEPATRHSKMGVALASEDCNGTVLVFYDEVLRVARQYHQPVPDILALAMAHEVGHVLLPPPSHSATDIMRAEWDGDDIRHAVVGQLTFTATQASLIRAKLAGCRAGGPASSGEMHSDFPQTSP